MIKIANENPVDTPHGGVYIGEASNLIQTSKLFHVYIGEVSNLIPTRKQFHVYIGEASNLIPTSKQFHVSAYSKFRESHVKLNAIQMVHLSFWTETLCTPGYNHNIYNVDLVLWYDLCPS